MKRKDLLGIRELDCAEILEILDTAESMQELSSRPIKKVPTLRGKTIINLFFESSTRTRTSFEIAGKWLSADVVNISMSTSSVSKGETLIDTAKTLDSMSADCVVIRHASSGAPHTIARMTKARVINGGDGAHEHPTQALLDALTIRQRKGSLERPQSRNRRRHRAQPRRAIQHSPADEIRIRRMGLFGADSDAREDGRTT